MGTKVTATLGYKTASQARAVSKYSFDSLATELVEESDLFEDVEVTSVDVLEVCCYTTKGKTNYRFEPESLPMADNDDDEDNNDTALVIYIVCAVSLVLIIVGVVLCVVFQKISDNKAQKAKAAKKQAKQKKRSSKRRSKRSKHKGRTSRKANTVSTGSQSVNVGFDMVDSKADDFDSANDSDSHEMQPAPKERRNSSTEEVHNLVNDAVRGIFSGDLPMSPDMKKDMPSLISVSTELQEGELID